MHTNIHTKKHTVHGPTKIYQTSIEKTMQCWIVVHIRNSRPGNDLSILLKIAANDELASDCSYQLVVDVTDPRVLKAHLYRQQRAVYKWTHKFAPLERLKEEQELDITFT